MKNLRSSGRIQALWRLPNSSHHTPKVRIWRQQQRSMAQMTPTIPQCITRGTVSLTHPPNYASWAGRIVTNLTNPTLRILRKARNRSSHSTHTIRSHEPAIHSLFEDKTGTWQYVVADPSSKKAVIIDPVLDYDGPTQTISTQTADDLLATILEEGYYIERILETHAHADHLTAASCLQQRLSSQQGFKPPICIGKRIREVQKRFAVRYGIPAVEYENAFDHLFEDDEIFEVGNLRVKVLHLPGHTPDHIGYQVGSNVFCGDSIFHADIGTARCDFPGGSAKSLYASAQKLLKLPDETKIWTGHDYPACPQRCEAVPWMTVQDHKEKNRHLANHAEDDFRILREERDASLNAPKLLHPSLQINIRAGRLPLPTPSGELLMRLPIKMKGGSWETGTERR